MEGFKIDIPVLIIFFVRPEPLAKVFEQVRIAKPSKLYLYQDGAREGRIDDVENVIKCREVVKNIDWECEVHYKYQSENYGCDPSEFISQKWMFEKEEYGIVLEDDDVPSQSFFPFCKEMLEKYKYDDRIGIVCGMNNLGITKSPNSYLFGQTGSIWGWATWKRNVDQWDENYEWLNDEYSLKLLEKSIGKRSFKSLLDPSIKHKESGRAHYETILGAHIFLNSKLNIIPAKNLISNIGIGENSTHAVNSINKLPRGLRKIFSMEVYDLEFPLIHPNYVIEDIDFKNKLDRLMGNGYPLVKFYRLLEATLYRLMSGDFQGLAKGFRRRLKLIN